MDPEHKKLLAENQAAAGQAETKTHTALHQTLHDAIAPCIPQGIGKNARSKHEAVVKKVLDAVLAVLEPPPA